MFFPIFDHSGQCFLFSLHKKANLAVQEGRLAVAMKDLADAQAILDAKQAELDAVKVSKRAVILIGIPQTTRFSGSFVFPC